MAEDWEDWNGLEMTILKSLAYFSKYTNDDVDNPVTKYKADKQSDWLHQDLLFIGALAALL